MPNDPQTTGVPPGFALVPIEPTMGMIRALFSWCPKDHPEAWRIGAWALGSLREDYQAMLAAAPKPDGAST
jgi:hypothetical protein